MHLLSLPYRSTVSRQNRLEVLRKGKLRHEVNSDSSSKDAKKDFPLKQKRKSKYLKGHRGHARKNRAYDDSDSSSHADNTLPIVCINQLAKELNTEECIKKSFGLDSHGRLPTEVVTIDDDDDDETPVAASKNESKYNDGDITYLSYIRVKPKILTKTENELFEKKLKENDGNRGVDMETISSPSAIREKRSLNTVVAMLRSTNKQSRTQLLEQYKQSKAKKQEHNQQQISGKENSAGSLKPSTSVIDLCDEKSEETHVLPTGDHTLLKQDGPINIPGKGEYRIVEKIVTKQGDKNKIILKLGKPSTSQPDSNTNVTLPAASHNSISTVHLSTTPVSDMHTVTNMVRNQPGLNEIMKTRCHKVRGLCKDLPKNPLLWTKRHVATFIQNADFKKYAKRFFDQVCLFIFQNFLMFYYLYLGVLFGRISPFCISAASYEVFSKVNARVLTIGRFFPKQITLLGVSFRGL